MTTLTLQPDGYEKLQKTIDLIQRIAHHAIMTDGEERLALFNIMGLCAAMRSDLNNHILITKGGNYAAN